jgi:hypothetical protein
MALLLAAPLSLAFLNAARATTVILDTVTGNLATPSITNNTGPGGGPVGLIRVGSSNVEIDHFGVYGNLPSAATVSWDIFTSAGALVYNSGPVALAASPNGSASWFDSPLLATPITLAANTNYYIGLMTTGNFFLQYYASGAVDVVGNGVTSPGGNFRGSPSNTVCGATPGGVCGSSGTASNFFNPALTRTDLSVQVAMRLYAPDNDVLPRPVPLPASAWLCGSGLLFMAWLARRRRRNTA